MPRVNHIKHARKPQKCDACGNTIQKGHPYKWAQRYRGPRMTRCSACEFKPSDMTTSKMGAIYDAQADFSIEDCSSLDEITSACEEFAGTVREVAEEYRESAQNIEDGFQHPTEQSEELSNKADELDSWADECEQAATSCDEFDEDEAKKEIQEEHKDDKEFDLEEAIEEKRSEWLESVRDEVSSTIDNCPV